MSTIIGLDVGGAHLKVAVVKNGRLTGAHQIVCPLWQGLDRLDVALTEAKSLTENAKQIAITMTGELSDLFNTREEGVQTLVDRLVGECGDKARFWMAQRGFGSALDAKAHHSDVGSTNFLATAQAVSLFAPNALLLDMGSTTTDIVGVVGGKPRATGLTDAQRLQTGELVYTGLTRTSVMAVANRVPFQDSWQTMAREHLATMADIYRLLGDLPDGVDLHDTADGRGKSRQESMARFARMLGRDYEDLTATQSGSAAWSETAQYIANEQLYSIEEGVSQVISTHAGLQKPTIVTAGIGARVVTKVALSLGLEHTTFGELVGAAPDVQEAVTFNAPAAAVALLCER